MKNQFEGGLTLMINYILDPDTPTLASQDKLKAPPKGLPFVIKRLTKTFPRRELTCFTKQTLGMYPLGEHLSIPSGNTFRD